MSIKWNLPLKALLSKKEPRPIRQKYAILTALAFACFASPCLPVTTQFLLIPMKEKLGPKTRAVVIAPQKKISFKALDCATTANLGGVISEFALAGGSKNYTGIAYSGKFKVERGGQVSGFVMSQPMPVGAQLSNFQLLEDGQTCSELINGKPFVFRKYVAIFSK